MCDSVAVDAAARLTFGGDVSTVLETPRSTRPPQTLEEARHQPGRRERIEAITKLIEAQGIKYVFFQQVSITGRVMGKGVVADFFPQVAERGYQLVYGATANLFTDRAGDYIGFGPEESELAAIADLDTLAPLPWDPRVARVLCDCYDTETGELLDADPRQNLKRVVAEFEEELGYSFLIGIEPEMMWLKRPRDGSDPDGVTKPYCYHIHQFEELRPVLLDVIEYGQALGLDMSYGDHEDAPGQLERLQELGLAEPHLHRAGGVRGPLRVPGRRLLLQPVPDRRLPPRGRARRHPQQERSRGAAERQHL
jgi:Glutamine synthetase, catalytic domain